MPLSSDMIFRKREGLYLEADRKEMTLVEFARMLGETDSADLKAILSEVRGEPHVSQDCSEKCEETPLHQAKHHNQK